MNTPFLPYFFDEALRASAARQPGDRERALGLTIDDLRWLNNVYLATDAARASANSPMHAKRLVLGNAGKTDIPLAGAFAMSRPNNGEVILYTPWKGLTKFADMDDLTGKLEEWLTEDTGKRELLRYLSIEQRHAALKIAGPALSTQDIEGAVFEDQEQRLELNQAQNIKTMLGELLKTPSLQWMLDETLKNALFRRFPNLNQRLTRLETVTSSAPDSQKSSWLSLSEALLQYYLTNQWPEGDSRRFIHPAHGVSSEADNQAWERAVTEIANSFTLHLQSLLETFWNSPMNLGPSREAFFCEGLQDAFCLELLMKRQKGTLTTAEYLDLMKVSLAPAASNSLRIEKVRVSAPFKHYAELATTLMIGSADSLGFLYTQSRGIEAASDLPSLRKIVLEMMKTEGHEDTLLNFMSLDERVTFLSLEPDERMIVGVPAGQPVFERLMADIRDKQQQNLSFALSRYRESEGTLEPHALFDKALDVRGLLDDRLLATDAAGRWSTRADLRWSAQPATVRAETAKEQLALLGTLEQTLDQRLEQHPAIPTTTLTVEEAQRVVDSSLTVFQSNFAHILSVALRSELKLRAVTRSLGEAEQTLIKTILDTPVRLQRAAFNGFLPDVFSLALKASGTTNALKLASCFVVTERGGLDLLHSGKAILWTPAFGYEVFNALSPLLTELNQRIKDPVQRLTLLENLGRSERLPGRSYTLAPLQRIDGHFIDEVQKNHILLDRISVTRALASKIAPVPLANLLKLVALRLPLTGLSRATDIALAMTTQQKLPAWLAKTSIKELNLHKELLEQYLDHVKDDQDYLSGIDALARTAHQALTQQLKTDALDVDPDQVSIQVSAGPTSAASSQTLTDFALSHLDGLDQLHFNLVSLNTSAIPNKMDASYIKGLVRNLKLGEKQQKKLDEALADTPENIGRRTRFYRQLPWQLMHFAHSEKLQERLSETGFDLVRQIMDMPDAIARSNLEGANAIIRPLEFTGAKSGETIKVPGVYLIGSSASSSTRQILLAPYSPRHGLREYDDEQQLLTELKTGESLRDWVLMNLPLAERATLDNRMALRQNRGARDTQTATDSPSNLALVSHPIQGNALKHLFNDNIVLLGRLLGCQSDSRRKSEWATIKQVLGEDLHAAYSFLMGKLAYPLTVWRSYRDLKQSAEDLQTNHWRAAIMAFISGMAQLASLRQSMPPTLASTASQNAPAPAPASSPKKWQDIQVTTPERTSLSRDENHNVELKSLTRDSTSGLYNHPTNKKRYAPIEGKVYQVIKSGIHWRIGDGDRHGPRLSANTSKQWQLAEDTPTARYCLLRRFDTIFSVWDGMHVDAVGMRRIRHLYPQKAREIEEALDLATSYAWNSFQNLQLLKPATEVVTPVHQLIMDFADLPQVLPAHVEKLEKVVGGLLTALLEPTLRKANSSRLAVGRAIDDPQGTFAFTVPKDDKHRIYLAERFFAPQFDNYRPHLTDGAFPISPHARATTIIHELSHIACGAEDIAYLDAGRPFPDLIGTSSTTATDLKNELEALQDTALSIRTPYTELFMDYDSNSGTWIEPEIDSPAAKLVLSLTGEDNLSGARTSFKKNPMIRLDVKLANADSVAWLITRLGRQLHSITP
ncbi:dermonecrotic toxin domain-containing protein [Pseudomonas vancouverensis]|uniref:dermonecrotic toxin domain-containing protein n=1 Tax=Pseudomonas vancouverensis TaxID=95300 RepID=UPI003CFC2C7D